MKIAVLIRTLNEEHRIDACCKSYSEFADEILIGDGGSTDNTIELALKYPKVKVRPFTMTIVTNGITRNPDGAHLNFLFDWAHEENADWIISQDCDQRPNKFLREEARKILEEAHETGMNFVMGVQIYLWKMTKYFPDMSFQSGHWMHGMWAHRASLNLRAICKMPHYMFGFDEKVPINIDEQPKRMLIDPPFCYMHHGWQDDAMVDKMVKYYRTLVGAQEHPINLCGVPKDLEDWMIE